MGDASTPVAPPAEEPPFPLTDLDRWVLGQTDKEFKRHDWQGFKDIIGQ